MRTDGSGVADGVARAAQLCSLHRAVTTGEPTECGIENPRRSQEIGIALAEAGRTKASLPARLGPETGWELKQHEAFRQRWGADPITDQDLLLRRFSEA